MKVDFNKQIPAITLTAENSLERDFLTNEININKVRIVSTVEQFNEIKEITIEFGKNHE